MQKSIRKLVVAGFLMVAAVAVDQPVQGYYSCEYERGYCNGLGGWITPTGQCPFFPSPNYISFYCEDEQGFLYDGCCYD